jgi:hypothetical protein
MSTIGSIAVNITAGTTKLETGFRNAQKIIDGFSRRATLVGGAVTAAFTGMLRLFDATGSQLHDLSVATGISVEQLDFLKYAAEQSGASIETLTKAARELQSNGIDPNQFEQIAATIAAITDPTQRAQAAFEAFGKKAGAALLPMLSDLPALRAQFEKLGGGFSGAMADAADEFGDSLGDLKLALRNVAIEVASALVPMIQSFTKWIAENMGAIRGWITEHQTLIKVVAGAGVVLTILGPIMTGLVTTITVLSTVVKALGLAFIFASANPIVFAIAGVVGAVVGLISILETFFGLWTKFKQALGFESAHLGVPGFNGTPAPSTSAGGFAGGGAGRLEQNTGEANSKLDEQTELLRMIAQGGGHFAVAGVE